MAKDIFKTVNEIQMHVTETQEEFIFSTISKWVNDSFNMSIKKDELVKAIQLIRIYKEHGYDISERYETATWKSYMLEKEYDRGYADGVKKEHDRIMNILEEVKLWVKNLILH